MTLSLSTLQLLSELLNAYSLPASHANFDEIAKAISTARKELDLALQELNQEN